MKAHQLAELLVKHGVVQPGAIYNAEGYDGFATLEGVSKVAADLPTQPIVLCQKTQQLHEQLNELHDQVESLLESVKVMQPTLPAEVKDGLELLRLEVRSQQMKGRQWE